MEFMLTLLFFLFVFFMIIEFAIVTYDRGTMNNAARLGARQASLYWVDPTCFEETRPQTNQRLKPAMVDTAMTFIEGNWLINPGPTGLNTTLRHNGSTFSAAGLCYTSGPTSSEVSIPVRPEDVTSIDINYAHEYLGLSGFVASTGLGLRSRSGAGVE